MDQFVKPRSAQLPASGSHEGGHYWPAVDGLRAIAILLVVAFHAGVPHLAGGYVGVDVFFVLSGYLITGLLGREIQRKGQIDLLDFYARRARWLLPALTVVLVATLLVGAMLLVPVGEQQALGKSAISASAFLANIYFWRTNSGYFAGPSEEMPLLHLWTLSVEEQFYIAWPLVMMTVAFLLVRRPRYVLPAILALLVIASLGSFAASIGFTRSHTTLTFYTVPFRAWEFGIGAMLALSPLPSMNSTAGRTLCAGLVIGGVGAVIVAALTYSADTVFPGSAAALPVLGTAAAITGVRASEGHWPARLLASPPMVTVGKLSYSWYLWHWPLLALGRAAAMGEHAVLRDGLLVLLALVLSALTYRYVEEPVRRHKPWPLTHRGQSVLGGLMLMSATAMLGGLLWWQAEQRAQTDSALRPVLAALDEKTRVPLECTHFRLPFTGLAPPETCLIGTSRTGPLVLLWGDSHAFHHLPALTRWADDHGARLLPRTMGACRPSVVQLPSDLPEGAILPAKSCVEFNSQVLASLAPLRAAGLSAVVLSAQWSAPSRFTGDAAQWEPGLKEVVAAIRAQGLAVLIVADGPSFAHAVPLCVVRRGPQACALPRPQFDAVRANTMTTLQRIATAHDRVHLLDLAELLCDELSCPVVRDGIVLYSDRNHISLAASLRLASGLGAALNPLLPVPR